MSQTDSLERARREALAFLGTPRTAVLACAEPGGAPQASYAPFVLEARDAGTVGAFYVYLSQLAGHTRALQANPNCGVMLIEDEAQSAEPFARRRLTFTCEARGIPRITARWAEVMDRFEASFGNVMTLIRPLEDFLLFELVPLRGSYVRGFGKAFRFEGGAIGEMVAVGSDPGATDTA